MRLINMDKLISHLNDYALQESPSDVDSQGKQKISAAVYKAIQNCINAVKEQPTAYDPDKVVEQLEEFRPEMEQFGCGGMLTDIIDVVKAGVADEM